jgi:hypothetical protein
MSAGGGTVQSSIRPPWALGLCDRCGFAFKLSELKVEIYDARPNGLLCCDVCRDVDNPQLQLGRVKVDDPQSLLDPRPDTGIPGSTGLFGWMPIGNPATNIQCFVGNLTVVIT